MPHLFRSLIYSLAVCLFCSASPAEEVKPVAADPERALDRYVSRPEPVYSWKLIEKADMSGLTVYRLELTSQTWQDIVWKHVLTVYEPANVQIQDHAILFVSGGSHNRTPGLDEQLLAIGIANLSGGRVALLKQVPNQPLFDDRVEDDLITETWLRYLKTGDESWPLLFPMVKSAVKAMDAVQELGQKEAWPKPIEKFVITGASKRGWTSWLTPVADERIVATAPCVIDTLNFRAQMDYQLETWGDFSEQIQDYTRKGLVRAKMDEETPQEAALRTMMDPWTYRKRLDLPKLIINGTNDRYWVVDASKNYFPDLVGPKYVLEIPNAGHNLQGGLDKVSASIAVLFRRAATGTPMPKVEWSFSDNGELSLNSDPPARSARLWTATSETNDFRNSKWTDQRIPGEKGTYETTIDAVQNQDARVAAFGELQFVDSTVNPPVTFSLTTTVKRYGPSNGQPTASE